MYSPIQALESLLRAVGTDTSDAARVRFEGSEPIFPTDFALATAGAAAIAATGLAADGLWALRSGRHQDVSIDLRHAAAALRSDRYLSIDGMPAPGGWADISGIYQTKDGRWLQVHCNFPHHRDGVLSRLACENTRESVAAAIARWEGQALEDTLAADGMCAALVRSRDEWLAHPQGMAVAGLPILEVIKIGDSAPEPLPAAERPLSGVRVLDLTRVLAGPVGGRTLAEHGADVMRVTAPHLPGYPHNLDIDTGHGKLSAALDLGQSADLTTLRELIRTAGVFIQGYRPGTLDARGLSPEALVELRPGLVYVTESAYGHEGPWRDRRGFDSLVQSASGIVDEEGHGGPPHHLPAQALDYITGYLLAFGVMTALTHRAVEGGSYLVRLSLAQTGRWIDSLGRVEGGRDQPDFGREAVEPYFIESESPIGQLRHVGPAVQMSETPPHWSRPSVPLGSSDARWP